MSISRVISWYEIPTINFERAVAFYQGMLGETLRLGESPDMPMAIFPYPEGHTGGALVHDPRRQPGPTGPTVYFVADHRAGGLEGCLRRAHESGAEVLLPRTNIGPNGFIALLRDPEGNVVGLHAES